MKKKRLLFLGNVSTSTVKMVNSFGFRTLVCVATGFLNGP